MNDLSVSVSNPTVAAQAPRPDAPPKVTVRGLNFYYGEHHALKNINLMLGTNRVTEVKVTATSGLTSDEVDRLVDDGERVDQRPALVVGEAALEAERIIRRGKADKPLDTDQMQLFIDPVKEIARQLAAASLDEMTPIQAFDLLRELKKKLT